MPVQAKLAAAWTSFMFLYVYVDILAFYKPGVVDDILVGVVWEFDITPTWATTALTLLAIPIFMVVLSMTLPARVNRITNLIVASVQVPFAAFNAVPQVGEPWMYFYVLGVALEVIVLAFILRSAWTWPRRTASHRNPGSQPRQRATAHAAAGVTARPSARPSFARATRGHGHPSQRSLLSTPAHPIPRERSPVMIEAFELTSVTATPPLCTPSASRSRPAP